MLAVLKKLLTRKNNLKIVLTILANEFSAFAAQAKQAANFADYVQIDVMDGEFVDNLSFPERQELDKWQGVENVFRAIFHIESSDNPQAVIEKIKKIGYSAGIAINPDTPLQKILPFLNQIDVVLFMTVVPGRQGNPFRPDVGEKIEMLKQVQHDNKKWPTIAVDGAINENTISEIKSWGVEIFNVGSALTRAPNMKVAYNSLLKKIK